MSAAKLNDAIEELLRQSLLAWRVGGEAAREVDGSLLVTADGRRLRITRAAAGLPFRWMVDDGERTRAASSVTGLLRHVRTAIDPAYRQVRLRIAPLPLVLP